MKVTREDVQRVAKQYLGVMQTVIVSRRTILREAS